MASEWERMWRRPFDRPELVWETEMADTKIAPVKGNDLTAPKLASAVAKLGQQLKQAQTPAEVAAIETAAAALRDLAKRAHLSREEQNRAGEVVLDSARTGGRMLKTMREEGTRQTGGGSPLQRIRVTPTLVDLGLSDSAISAQQRAFRWSCIGQLPENLYSDFKRDIVASSNDAVLTMAGAIAFFKKWKREQDLKEQARAIAAGEFQTGVGPYDVIVYDPPWPYGTQETYHPDTRRGSTPYPEMSLEEIAADGEREISAKGVEDCILWLWTTHKFMRHSFPLLDRWGFSDKMIVTWEKQKMGLGRWLRSKSEFCIMAVRGSPATQLTNQTTMVHGDMREHSRKPDEFYEMIESLCLGVRRYDRFTREARPTWDGGGNEPEKFNG